MTTPHDREMQEVVAECRDCGAAITRYYYRGFPFCSECRGAYRERRFEESREGRGRKQGSITHLPSDDLFSGRYSACGGRHVRSWDVLGGDPATNPVCRTCAKVVAADAGIDLREEDLCEAVCPEHKEPCSVANPRDVAGLAVLFGGKDFTLREHRKKGPHLCFSGGSPPKPHTWGGA